MRKNFRSTENTCFRARHGLYSPDAGGPAEYVSHGETGFVVPIGDPSVMAERVKWLLSHETEREEMGTRARARAESHFAYDRMIDETISLYRSLLVDIRSRR